MKQSVPMKLDSLLVLHNITMVEFYIMIMEKFVHCIKMVTGNLYNMILKLFFSNMCIVFNFFF